MNIADRRAHFRKLQAMTPQQRAADLQETIELARASTVPVQRVQGSSIPAPRWDGEKLVSVEMPGNGWKAKRDRARGNAKSRSAANVGRPRKDSA